LYSHQPTAKKIVLQDETLKKKNPKKRKRKRKEKKRKTLFPLAQHHGS
jgi:hypothetical protein